MRPAFLWLWLIAACAEPSVAPTAETTNPDVGLAMEPLRARPPGQPLEEARPVCDPTWRERLPLPPGSRLRFSTAGSQIVAVGWGLAAISDGERWVVADPSTIPDIELSSRTRVVFGDALALAEDEVYVVGTRMTVMRWDGRAWRMENQDRRLGERRTHNAQLVECDGRIIAHAHRVALEREEGGSWRRLNDEERATVRTHCAPPQTYPRPSEPCGNFIPMDRVVRCRAGMRVYSQRTGRWLAFPDEVGRYPRILEHEGGLFLLGDQGLFHNDGRIWAREEVDDEPTQIFGDEVRIHAVAGGRIYVRDLCESLTGRERE